ncbi:hypothetical protein [Myxococcus landrumensis]|uniref:Cytochrome c domain-containing protein n=1 Tax=Myxococcus landrumensis TaxID=2813577 RepID=A0ABX7NK79_9BACT|nr:hypothetical protein [Myxococcus landrumus]QSQ17884.1 hypothetical protein JY572_18395 [Myxococcus landrumus]
MEPPAARTAPSPAPITQAPASPEPVTQAPPSPGLLLSDPAELILLERQGLSFGQQLGVPAEDAQSLLTSPRYASFVAVIERDLAELSSREGIALSQFPLDPKRLNYVFDAKWLRSPRARFQLVGVVNRLDMRFSTPKECGQLRLIYRLALQPEGRPVVRLPMTLNVIRPLPLGPGGSCRAIAQQWRALPANASERVAMVTRMVTRLPPMSGLETNFQNLHGPGTPDADDHAEYVLRSFDVRRERLVPRPLLNTPRADLDPAERKALLGWIARNFMEIDAGRSVIPDRFLATRAISVSPRGLSRPANRVFSVLFNAEVDSGAFAELPYAKAKRVRSPRGLLRRLDGFTCAGCHQSRAVAGFHLPGEERDADQTFNALAVGVSPHLHEELGWRGRLLASVAEGTAFVEPRPFPERPSSVGFYGSHCGLGDPTFADWTCQAGLECRDSHHDEVGFCAPAVRTSGDACENARVVARPGASGDQLVADAPEECQGQPPDGIPCITNRFGFPLGSCSVACAQPGARSGSSVCAMMLVSGYEQVCFPLEEPIEDCVRKRGFVAAMTTRACSVDEPCRDDYGCSRYPGSAPGTGACVPPYFLFDFRVDGPKLDR